MRIYIIIFFFNWETNHAIDHALSKCNSFHLLYLDPLIHQSHQQYTAVHRFREWIGIGDLYSCSFVHYNPARNLNDKDTFPIIHLYFSQLNCKESISLYLKMNEILIGVLEFNT